MATPTRLYPRWVEGFHFLSCSIACDGREHFNLSRYPIISPLCRPLYRRYLEATRAQDLAWASYLGQQVPFVSRCAWLKWHANRICIVRSAPADSFGLLRHQTPSYPPCFFVMNPSDPLIAHADIPDRPAVMDTTYGHPKAWLHGASMMPLHCTGS
jgi:hypothetical protein